MSTTLFSVTTLPLRCPSGGFYGSKCETRAPARSGDGRQVGALQTAGNGAATPASGFERWLVSQPLSFWMVAWFLVQVVVLTAIGTFLRGPGWSWVWPWRSQIRRKLDVLRRLFCGGSAHAFGTVSLLLLGSLEMAVARDHRSPWRFYQRQYLRLARGRSGSAAAVLP
jgi:hypothetical protein